jgi:hypothetical protein
MSAHRSVRAYEHKSISIIFAYALVTYALMHFMRPVQSKIDMVKLLRVYGGCLGVERR